MEVTAEGKVVDKSEPKGIVAMQKAMRQPIESPQVIKEEVTAKRKETISIKDQNPCARSKKH